MEMNDRRIIIVGCGPGSPDYITPAAACAALGADVLLGAPRLHALFPAARARRIETGGDVQFVLDQVENVRQRGTVAVLVSGSPGIYSMSRAVIRRFGITACRIIPAVSSVQAAFAALGLDCVGARIISAHGRRPDIDAVELGQADRIAVLGGTVAAQTWLADFLDEVGEELDLFVCENLTLPEERIRRMDAPRLRREKLSSLTVFILVKKDMVQSDWPQPEEREDT
jgi:precorrin-6y C5,15-methyltransferase (decarboxylating) CbiE subunit